MDSGETYEELEEQRKDAKDRILSMFAQTNLKEEFTQDNLRIKANVKYG